MSVHALVQGFDHAFGIWHFTEEMLGRAIELHVFVDSKTLITIIAKDGPTHERQLQIDIRALHESYVNGELTKLACIPGNRNSADALPGL